jgi:hypothetical protein
MEPINIREIGVNNSTKKEINTITVNKEGEMEENYFMWNLDFALEKKAEKELESENIPLNKININNRKEFYADILVRELLKKLEV